MNTYWLAVGIMWWLEHRCIVNVINMHLCLSLPYPLCPLFYQMLFLRNARAIKIHVKWSGMKKTSLHCFLPRSWCIKVAGTEKVLAKLKVKRRRHHECLVISYSCPLPDGEPSTSICEPNWERTGVSVVTVIPRLNPR